MDSKKRYRCVVKRVEITILVSGPLGETMGLTASSHDVDTLYRMVDVTKSALGEERPPNFGDASWIRMDESPYIDCKAGAQV